MIKVLVVDDTLVARELLVHLLESDPEIQVVGTAPDGVAALAAQERLRPDLITMDIHMPKMDGFEATRRIMETQPVPVVIVSASWQPEEVAKTFQAMEAGAVAVIEKPHGPGHPDAAEQTRKLLQTVKAMAEVKVVRRWVRKPTAPGVSSSVSPGSVSTGVSSTSTPAVAPAATPAMAPRHGAVKLVAIGASTGGPPVLHAILAKLPHDFAAPILIVQHIAAGFLQGLADWLGSGGALPVHIATQGETLRPGWVYLAPDDWHLGVDRGGRIALSNAPPENGLRPAVSHLFRAVAEAYGASAAGVLLTGMGRDGADELKLLKNKGAVTIAQDKDTSVVHGMPGEAIKLDAATYVLPPDRIAALLAGLAR